MSKKNPSSSYRSKNDNRVEDEVEVLEKLQIEFNRFDKQKTGKITWKQAKTGFLNLGYNESEVNNLSVGSDKTLKKKSSKRRKYNDNNITFDQFISYTMNFQIPKKEDNQKEKSQHAFQLLDHDNSGAITFHHLKRAAKILGEPFTDEELQEMMDEMDLDGDGQINFQEFLRIMKKVNLY